MWVTGVEVNAIGTSNMGVVEDAFSYRMVWALEALRTRRVSLGWAPEIIAGGGAAALETGVPQFMMAMLIRAGLPSRRAAMIAIREGDADFVDSAGMREWLASDEIAELTQTGGWPTPETAALWGRFRSDTLSGGIRTTEISEIRLALAPGQIRPADGTYRVESDADGNAWICTPDYRRISKLRRRLRDRARGLLSARFVAGDNRAIIHRSGSGRAIWLEPDE